MTTKKVKVNGLAEFAHYYNKNTDMILDKIENNRNEAITHHNEMGNTFMKAHNANARNIKKIAFWNAVALLGLGVFKLTTDAKIDRLQKKIRELEDEKVVREFKEDDVKLYSVSGEKEANDLK